MRWRFKLQSYLQPPPRATFCVFYGLNLLKLLLVCFRAFNYSQQNLARLHTRPHRHTPHRCLPFGKSSPSPACRRLLSLFRRFEREQRLFLPCDLPSCLPFSPALPGRIHKRRRSMHPARGTSTRRSSWEETTAPRARRRAPRWRHQAELALLTKARKQRASETGPISFMNGAAKRNRGSATTAGTIQQCPRGVNATPMLEAIRTRGAVFLRPTSTTTCDAKHFPPTTAAERQPP